MVDINNSYEVIIAKIFIEKNIMNNKKEFYIYINYILFKEK